MGCQTFQASFARPYSPSRVFPALAPEPLGAPPRRYISITTHVAKMTLPYDLDFGDAQTALSAGADALKSVRGFPFVPRSKSSTAEAGVGTDEQCLPCHGCCSTQESRVRNACDDVACTVHQSLSGGRHRGSSGAVAASNRVDAEVCRLHHGGCIRLPTCAVPAC
jgi:hypothetical protein